MNYSEYLSRMGKVFTDKDKIDKLKNFIYLQINILDDYIQYQDEKELCKLFYKRICETTSDYYFYNIANYIKREGDFSNLLILYSTFLTILKNKDYKLFLYCKNELFKTIEDYHFNINIIEDEDGCYIFPSGNKDMDEALILESFEWLNKYPNIRELAINSMKKYYSMNGEDISEIVDGFRKLLEQFMQKYFGVSSSLANMKSLYGNKLNESGVNTEVASEFEKILNLYDMYNNNHAKHHKDAKRNDVEYIMYETFNIIRLLLQIE